MVVHERRFHGREMAETALRELCKYDVSITSEHHIGGTSSAEISASECNELLSQEWMTVSASGEELAGWNTFDNYLTVNFGGPWDEDIDKLDPRIIPWSWLIILGPQSTGNSGADAHGVIPSKMTGLATRVLRANFDSQEVAQRLDLDQFRGVTLTIKPSAKRASIVFSGDELLVLTPPPLEWSDSRVCEWWNATFNLITVAGAHRLGSSTTTPGEAEPPEIEGIVRILDPKEDPDELSLRVQDAFAGWEVIVDAQYLESGVVIVPVSGRDVAAAFRSVAESAGRIEGVGKVELTPGSTP